jgi:Flp pilus assembly protein TadG
VPVAFSRSCRLTLCRLLSDRRGATAITTAVAATMLLGFAGVGIDIAVWQTTKRNMQGAADQAVYSAAMAVKAGANGRTNARGVATQMGFVDGQDGVTVTVNNPPTQGSATSNSAAWEVIISKPQSMWFSHLFLASAPVASARAVVVPGNAGYCVLVTEPSASGALNIQGTPSLSTPSCSVQVNSTSATGVTLGGSAQIVANTLSMVGNPGYSVNGSAAVSATIDSGASPISDPYANVNIPDISLYPCINTTLSVPNHGLLIVPAGPLRYCHGISVSSGGTLTFTGGTYYIDGNQFQANGGTINSLGGTTIVLTGSGSNYATINLTGNVTVDLTAPSSGTFAGITVYQDRNAPSTTTNTLTGGSNQKFTGDLYFPNTSLTYGGNAASTTCTHLIVRTLSFSGSSALQNSCAGVGNKSILGRTTSVSE